MNEGMQEWADEYEKAWLLLADMYIDSGKYDLATELCEKVRKSNMSNAKVRARWASSWVDRILPTDWACAHQAYELEGLIKEKETAYRDAAKLYEKAWACSNGKSAAIGYRLAFNYLKVGIRPRLRIAANGRTRSAGQTLRGGDRCGARGAEAGAGLPGAPQGGAGQGARAAAPVSQPAACRADEQPRERWMGRDFTNAKCLLISPVTTDAAARRPAKPGISDARERPGARCTSG
jgi:hypothetical protein